MARKTIKLKDYLKIVEEALASAAIIPGMLVEFQSTGKVRPHNTANGEFVTAFATEDEFQGKTIADAYAIDTPVQIWIPQRGDNVYALLAPGQEVVIGDKLTSAGGGLLRKYASASADAGHIVGEAIEAVDNSESSNAARIMVRVA